MSSTQHGIAIHFVENTIKAPLLSYKLDIGNYPTTDEGFQALLSAPKGKEEKWKGPYLEKLPIDPWGNPYQYRYPPTNEDVDYDFFSVGQDGVESRDDIANWKANKEPTPLFIFLIGTSFIIIVIAMIWRKIITSRED